MIDELTAKWLGAVVALTDRQGNKMERAAVFFFDTPTGFGWLEPGYADPWGSPSPTWHEIDCAIAVQDPTTFTFSGPEWKGDVEEYFGQPVAEFQITWFENRLKEMGRTWAEERARVIADGIVPGNPPSGG